MEQIDEFVTKKIKRRVTKADATKRKPSYLASEIINN